MVKPSRLCGRLYLRLCSDSETPAMVFVQSRGRVVDSGTFWRVREEGFDSIDLTPVESDWLDSLDAVVDAHCAALQEKA